MSVDPSSEWAWSSIIDAEPKQFTEADLLAAFEQMERSDVEARKQQGERLRAAGAWWDALTAEQKENPLVQIGYEYARSGIPMHPNLYRKIEEALGER